MSEVLLGGVWRRRCSGWTILTLDCMRIPILLLMLAVSHMGRRSLIAVAHLLTDRVAL